MRHKRHRPAQPDLIGSTSKEIHAEAVLWPLSVLTGVLGRDRAFRDHCANIAAGSLSVEEVARRYVRREWPGRHVIEHLLRVGATRGVAMLSSECAYTVSADEPLASGDRRRWTRSNAQYPRGAVLLARLGGGVCLKDDCITYPRKGRPYCNAHARRHPRDTVETAVRDANRRAMRLVLEEAGAGLDLAYANPRSVGPIPPIASSAGEPPLLQRVGALRVRTEDEAEYQRLMAAAPTPEQEQRHRDLLHALHAREQEREAAAEAERWPVHTFVRTPAAERQT